MGEMVGHLVLFVLFLWFFGVAVCDLVRVQVLTCPFPRWSISPLCILKLLHVLESEWMRRFLFKEEMWPDLSC